MNPKTPDPCDSSKSYHIHVGGIRPEAGQSYHYSDNRYDLWFYIHCKAPPEADEPTILVHHATTNASSGTLPKVAQADRALIERNIRDYFKRVDTLEQPTSPSNPPIPVKFTWRIGQ